MVGVAGVKRGLGAVESVGRVAQGVGTTHQVRHRSKVSLATLVCHVASSSPHTANQLALAH